VGDERVVCDEDLHGGNGTVGVSLPHLLRADTVESQSMKV
jgi:hypothetical protein